VLLAFDFEILASLVVAFGFSTDIILPVLALIS
jgi:hypothetical protein